MSVGIEIETPGIDIGLVMRPLAMVGGDPTIRLRQGSLERATWTPDGPGAIRVTWQAREGRAHVETFGEGGNWLASRAAAFVGVTDDPSGFQPEPGVVRDLWRRFHGDRVSRTETAWHDVCWAIVQQRVHRRDAAAQWQSLVRSLGEPAPGIDGLYVPPEPARMARATPWSLRPLGIDAHRTTALINAARHAHALQRLTGEPAASALLKVQQIRGIGPWTAGCMSAFTYGDPDTVIVGDSGMPSMVAATLAGERYADDARMLELLEPYRPHRYRVLRLALAARSHRLGDHWG